MITNPARTQAVSTLGWVDKGGLWVYDAGRRLARPIEPGDAKWLSIKAGRNNWFAVVHHWNSDRLDVSAHSHSEPSRTISRISFHRATTAPNAETRVSMEGDISVWKKLPRAYTGFAFGEYQLLLIDHRGGVETQTLGWFNDSYDKAYQNFIGKFCFDATEKLCLVARPFSGDAVVLESDSMRQKRCVQLGRQPLDVALLAGDTVIARDWKTGDLLTER